MDLESISDDELSALIAELEAEQAAPAPVPDVAQDLPLDLPDDPTTLSDSDLDALISKLEADQNGPGLAKVLSSAADKAQDLLMGVWRGTAQTAGLVGDLLKYAVLGPPTPKINDKGKVEIERPMPISTQINESLDETLPKYSNEYVGTIGEFVGPGTILTKGPKALSKADDLYDAAKIISNKMFKTAKTDVPAAVATQYVEDTTNDPVLATMAALFGGAGANILYGGGKHAINAVKPASQSEIRATAARVFKDVTGLDEAQIAAAIDNLPDDELARLMTTAEVTNNAGASQIEKTLTQSGEGAQKALDRASAREDLREAMLSKMTDSGEVNRETLVDNLRGAAREKEKGMFEAEKLLWEQLPRKVPIDVSPYKADLKHTVDERRGYGTLGLNDKINKLYKQFMEAKDPKMKLYNEIEAKEAILKEMIDLDNIDFSVDAAQKGGKYISSGALQNMRSDLLGVQREMAERSGSLPGNITVAEKLDNLIIRAMDAGLEGPDFEIWEAARKMTAERKGLFGSETAGGKLLDKTIADENLIGKVVRGDTKSAKQLKEVLEESPELIEDVKSFILQDPKLRDVDDKLTPYKFKSFLNSRGHALKELFGDEHFANMRRISEDLISESSVKKKGFLSSKGNSVTAQKMTVAEALDRALVDKQGRGSGWLGSWAEGIRKSLGRDNEARIKELLIEASFDPLTAKELAATATDERLMSAAERIVDTLKKSSSLGGREALIELGRYNDAIDSRREQEQIEKELSGRLEKYRSNNDPSEIPQKQQTRGQETQRRPELILSKSLGNYSTGGELVRVAEDLAMSTEITDELLDQLRMVESGGGKYLESPAGAKGPYQLMDNTGKRIHKILGIKEEYDPYDEDQARAIAKYHLEDGLKRFGRLDLALADYNAGHSRVKQALRKAEKIGASGSKEIQSQLERSVIDLVENYGKSVEEAKQIVALELAFRDLGVKETADYIRKFDGFV